MINSTIVPSTNSTVSSYVISVQGSVQTKVVTQDETFDQKAAKLFTDYLQETIDLFKKKRHQLFPE